MRLHNLYEEEKKGTYAGIHFDDDTKDRIMKFIKDNKIPNPYTYLLLVHNHCV